MDGHQGRNALRILLLALKFPQALSICVATQQSADLLRCLRLRPTGSPAHKGIP